MISMATTTSQRDPIVLTDPNVEHSLVVKEVLDIIYSLEVHALTAWESSNLYLYVVDFATKWEMNMVTGLFGRELMRYIEVEKEAWRSFGFLLLALRLGDNSLAAKCCNEMDRVEWCQAQPTSSPEDEGDNQEYFAEKWEFEEDDGLPINYLNDRPSHQLTKNNPLAATLGGNLLDIRVMAYDDFLRLPPTVAWIILHASIGHEPGSGSIENKVKQLLDLACESASTSPMVDRS